MKLYSQCVDQGVSGRQALPAQTIQKQNHKGIPQKNEKKTSGTLQKIVQTNKLQVNHLISHNKLKAPLVV